MPDEITGQASTQVSSNTSWRNHSSAKLKKESLKPSQNKKQESEIIDELNWVCCAFCHQLKATTTHVDTTPSAA